MSRGVWPEASPSTGWRAVYDVMNVPQPNPDDGSRCVGQSPPPKQHMKIAATDETGQSQSHMITLAHRSPQVIVRVFGGSSEGRGGTPSPLRGPLFYPYSIVGNHGDPPGSAREGGGAE